MLNQDTTLLSQSTLFNELSHEELERVIGVCSRKQIGPRTVVFYQGDPGREMYVVLSGRLKVSVTSEDGKELAFFILQKNDIFGELALLDGERRSATVTSIESCELLVLKQQDFKRLLADNPLMGLKMLSILAGRLRATTSLYESSVFVEIPGRLAAKLLELAEEHGTVTDDGIQIDLKLSQYELGTLINATRESVNKQLKTWEGQGLIELRKGRVFLAQPQVLEALTYE